MTLTNLEMDVLDVAFGVALEFKGGVTAFAAERLSRTVDHQMIFEIRPAVVVFGADVASMSLFPVGVDFRFFRRQRNFLLHRQFLDVQQDPVVLQLAFGEEFARTIGVVFIAFVAPESLFLQMGRLDVLLGGSKDRESGRTEIAAKRLGVRM